MSGINTKFSINEEVYAVVKENSTSKNAPISVKMSGPYIIKSINITPKLKRASDGLTIGSDLTSYDIYYNMTKTGFKFLEDELFLNRHEAYEHLCEMENKISAKDIVESLIGK